MSDRKNRNGLSEDTMDDLLNMIGDEPSEGFEMNGIFDSHEDRDAAFLSSTPNGNSSRRKDKAKRNTRMERNNSSQSQGTKASNIERSGSYKNLEFPRDERNIFSFSSSMRNLLARRFRKEQSEQSILDHPSSNSKKDELAGDADMLPRPQ
mmetsp:Transcript_14403/g.21887  ORF Transcript_14403/g.21887 Transcript_14403/m.21887 type:complete len:151 (-) Transcript_14403:189-641(-)